MHLKNIENRYLVEKVAVKNILDYMKSLGAEYIYSESTHEYPVFRNKFLFDGDLSSFMAGNICNAMPNIKEVAYGRTASDDLDAGSVTRIEKANNIFKALCNAQKIYPVQNMTKKEIFDMLPEDLRKLSWSCRRPIYIENDATPCQKCKTCKEMVKLGIGLNQKQNIL